MAKRGATIREGFEYQDLIAAESILKLVGPGDRPQFVTLEDRQGGKFDDVVEWYSNTVIWKQVKWAANPFGDPYTLQNLAESPTQQKKSLIRGFADSYRKICETRKNFSFELISNRHVDATFREYLCSEPARIRSDLARKKKQILKQCWLSESQMSETDFQDFLTRLRFDIGRGGHEVQERRVREKLASLGVSGKENFTLLIDAIKEWAVEPQDRPITADDLRGVLSLVADVPDNMFKLPAPALVLRDDVQGLLKLRLGQYDRGYLVLLGLAGTGKSTAVNTIGTVQPIIPGTIIIVYNCFTGPGDLHLRKRSNADNFTTFLWGKLYERFGTAWHPRLVTTHDELINIVSAASDALKQGEQLVIVIDGLDYARRYAVPEGPNLIDHLPLELPPNVFFLVTAQVQEQLPEHLRALDADRYLDLPKLDRFAIETLLEQYRVFNLYQIGALGDRDRLVDLVWERSQGHPLYTTYVAKSLAETDPSVRNPENLLSAIAPYDKDIESTYRRLFSVATGSLRQDLIRVLSSCPCPLTAKEAASLLDTPGDAHAAEDVLNEVAFLFDRDNDLYSFWHDSLRDFANKMFGEIVDQTRFIPFLMGLPADPRTGEYLLPLLVEHHQSNLAKSFCNQDWLAQQLANGASPTALARGLLDLMQDAISRIDILQTMRWGLLREKLRLTIQGHLEWTDLTAAWLALGEDSCVAWYAMERGRLQVSVQEAVAIAKDALSAGHSALATKLYRAAADSVITEPRTEGLFGQEYDQEVSARIYALSRHVAPEVVMATIVRYASSATELYRVTPLNVEDYKRHLAKIAVESCLASNDIESVLTWLSLETSCLTETDRRAFRVRLLRLQGNVAKNREIFEEALQNHPSLDLLEFLVRIPEFHQNVKEALVSRPIPSTLNSEYSAWYPHEYRKRLRDLDRFSADLRLSYTLRLDPRMQTIITATENTRLRSLRFLHRLLIHMVQGEAQPTSRIPWQGVAEQVRQEMVSLFALRERREDWEVCQFFTKHLGFLLQPLQNHAKNENQELAFATWLQGGILPVLKDVKMCDPDTYVSLLIAVVPAAADKSHYEWVFNEAETCCLEYEISKSSHWLRLATAFGRAGNLNRGKHALLAGVRASFSYGYHGDLSLAAAVDALREIGYSFGDDLERKINFLATLVRHVDLLSDKDNLHHVPAELVAVVARWNPNASASLARHFHETLTPPLWGYSVTEMLIREGADTPAIRAAFAAEAAQIELLPVPPDSEPAPPAQEYSFAEVERLIDEEIATRGSYVTLDLLQTRSMRMELISAAADMNELERVPAIIQRHHQMYPADWGKLALRARELGHNVLAWQYAMQAVQNGSPLRGGFGNANETEALYLICRLDPPQARPVLVACLQRAVNASAVEVGYVSIPVLIHALVLLNDKACAMGLYDELEEMLRQSIASYPSP